MEKKNGLTEVDAPEKITVYHLQPSGEKPSSVTEEDVWGKWNEDRTKRLDKGMIKARTGEICPYFGDKLDHKDVTVVCNKEDYDAVVYWLEYVYGGGCVEKTKEIDDGKIAIRSAYMAW